MDVRQNDPLQAPIQHPDDERLMTILEFGDMALQMAGRQGKRQKELTRETAQTIYHTCKGLVSLCRHLLSMSHDYVLLGQFSTDPLEKEFSKLRQALVVRTSLSCNKWWRRRGSTEPSCC